MTAAMLAVTQAEPVPTDDLLNAQDNAGEWLMYGRDYRNWRYSPLAEITPANAAKLTPAWGIVDRRHFPGLVARATDAGVRAPSLADEIWRVPILPADRSRLKR
jgi:hypothetical protein